MGRAIGSACGPQHHRRCHEHPTFTLAVCCGFPASRPVSSPRRRYYFNRGALFNAAALLLEGTDYDHYAFHDVDTVCGEQAIPYTYPAGVAPLHLTPPGLHPRDDYPEFLGGNIIFSREQFKTVNGFHVRP